MPVSLRVDPHIDAIVETVRQKRRAIIVAPPGSGKTTRIPPALTSLGRTILLQPRRVAARALTRRIASERHWTIGDEIGWHIRFERRFFSRTQLLVATEGILTARLQSDPLLSDFRVVVLHAIDPLQFQGHVLFQNLAHSMYAHSRLQTAMSRTVPLPLDNSKILRNALRCLFRCLAGAHSLLSCISPI